MNPTFPFALAMAALLAVRGVPPHQERADEFGQVLLLDNEHVLRGKIQRQGDQYTVSGPIGEVQVPVNKALTVCPSIQDAFRFLGSRVNLRDGNERLRLARWCYVNGLDDQAVAEAKAAMLFGGAADEAKRLLGALERRAAPSTPPVPTEETPALQIDAAPLDVSAESLALFSSKVQTILMNTCASCHASGRGGDFVLMRPTGNVTRRATQSNLTAVIKQIHFDRPDASPLLSQACSPHGGAANAALANGLAPPFSTLKGWVEMVAAQNPHLKAHGVINVAAGALPLPEARQTPLAKVAYPFTAEAPVAANPPVARSVESHPSPTPPQASDGAVQIRSLPTTAAPTASCTSPYDPALFNTKR